MTDHKTLVLEAQFDRRLIEDSGNSNRYLVVTVTAPRQQEDKVETERRPLNLSLVIDASGSMQGRPLEFAKRAAAGVVESLSQRDIVSVISFASDVRTHVDALRPNGSGIESAITSIDTITSRDMTDLSGGWFRGAESLAQVMEDSPACHNRVVLLSDGHANRGITDPAELQHHAEELRRRGLFTSTVGIGDGYSSVQLQALAEFGGGRMHDAERPEEIVEVLLGEIGELSETVVESVSVSVGIPAGVQIENLSRFPTDITPTGVVTHIGSLIADSPRTIVFKITAPAGAIGDSLKFEVAATSTSSGSETPVVSGAVTTKLTYAGSDENRAQPREDEISRVVASTWQATVVRRMAELNRRKQTAEAERYLASQLVQFRDYCRDLPGTKELIEELEKMGRVVHREWGERGRKEMELASFKMMRNENDHRRMAREKWAKFLPSDEMDRSQFGGDPECYSFRVIDGHVVAEINGSKVLISTGTPLSICDGRSLRLGGRTFALGRDLLGMNTRQLSQMIGTRIDILLGNDVLRQTAFEVDPSRMQLRFFNDTSSLSGKRLPITLVMGAPTIDVEISGQVVPMFVDTSAKLSYATSSLVSGEQVIRTERDFYPGFGTFTTDLRRLNVGIAGNSFVIECGTLPQVLQTSLLVAGVEGILGADLIRHCAVAFDLGKRSIFLRRVTVNAATA